MSTRLAPRARVEGQTPSRPSRGLLSVASVVEYDLPIRWGAGAVVDPFPCGTAEVWTPDCDDLGADNPKPPDEMGPADGGVEFDPFHVIFLDACSTLGRAPTADQDAAARASFDAAEDQAIEAEFWTGTIASGNPALAAAETVEAGDPAGIVDALGQLEEAIAGTARTGVIHVTPTAAVWLARYHLITLAGARMVTPLGTPVAIGTGYPGTGPGGTPAPAGSSWMYATGAVRIHRAPVQVLHDVDHEINREVVRVEREVLVEYDTCIRFAQLAGHGEAVVPEITSGS